MTNVRYCGVCGSPLVEAGGGDPGGAGRAADPRAAAASGAHLGCEARRELEPPRYCAWCGRRMVVQVTPLGWSARCSRHGELRGGR